MARIKDEQRQKQKHGLKPNNNMKTKDMVS